MSAKNFDIKYIDDFKGYNSANDRTNVDIRYLVRGSKNVYKKINGNLAVRPGQKRLGDANSALSACSSEYVWNTSLGNTYILVVADSKLYVVVDNVWHVLQSDLTETRYVFDSWWDDTAKRDQALFVNGNDYIQTWYGGVATVASSTATTITKTGSTTWQQAGFHNVTTNSVGASSTQFDITNPSGTTFRYTWDGTGTDPGISATTMPVYSYVLLAGANFSSANNGLFQVTASGTNYFEVTNASGVAENNKTLGAGYMYIRFTNLVTIDGTTFGFTGINSTELTGVTPSAASVTVGSTALSGVITYDNSPAADFMNDFIKVINNQLYVGSYTSRLLYISTNVDFTDFTPDSPSEPGDAAVLTLDATLKGIGLRQGQAHVGVGSDRWAVINIQITVTADGLESQSVTVDYKPLSILQAPYAHEFIDTVGDTLVYLAQDQQVRSYGGAANLFTPAYPSLSQQIYTELQEQDFTGGALKCIGDFTYVTSPVSGSVYLYQVRQHLADNGEVYSERLWHPPFVWSLTRVDSINGVIIGFSSSNPQIYQLWDTEQYYDDSPFDEDLPYECVAAFAYRNGGIRQGLISFDKVFTEGYITSGTPLYIEANYDYQGATGNPIFTVNSVDRPATLYVGTNPSSLGDASFGDNPLGTEIGDPSDNPDQLSKFYCINSISPVNCFEYQLVYSSDTANAQWELLATGTNEHIEDNLPTFIINKQR